VSRVPAQSEVLPEHARATDRPRCERSRTRSHSAAWPIAPSRPSGAQFEFTVARALAKTQAFAQSRRSRKKAAQVRLLQQNRPKADSCTAAKWVLFDHLVGADH
jgi:hypothetical protein